MDENQNTSTQPADNNVGAAQGGQDAVAGAIAEIASVLKGSSDTQQKSSDQPIFTQEQVNSIVSGRVTQLNAKIAELSKEIETYKTESATYKGKLESYEQQAELSKAGIPESIREYALFEIQKLSANGKSFAENTAEYVKANEAFINTIKQSGQQSSQQTAGVGAMQQNNGAGTQPTPSAQSPLLQQLAGRAVSTNGQGTMSLQGNSGLAGLNVDEILAKEGIKRRK